MAPPGQSLLVDTGWPDFGGRDAERIVAAARLASLKRIDHVLITHYHRDHVGGAPQLADSIPIGTFIDHGPSAETGKEAEGLFSAYQKLLQKTPRRVVTPGDLIALGEAKVGVLTANGECIRTGVQGPRRQEPTKPYQTNLTALGRRVPASPILIARQWRARKMIPPRTLAPSESC